MKAFLSYPSEHTEDAREVKRFVAATGVVCWFDKDDLEAGDDWERERRLAQADADVIIILCASQTIGRNGVYQREITQALEAVLDRRLGTTYILSLRLKDVELPPELSRFHYVDKFDPSWRRRMAGGLLKAFKGLGTTPPAALQIAGAKPDEGGITSRDIKETRSEGEIGASWLQYAMGGEYWEFVNAIISARALGGVYSARRRLSDWERAGSYWELHISEAHRKGDLVCLTVGHSSYFAGAAHPNHGIETINILGPQVGIVTAAELFDYSQDALNFISEYVSLDLRRQFAGGDGPDVSSYIGTDDWQMLEHFTYNEKGIVFTMSSSLGLPHAFGVLDVYMPWEHVAQFLIPAARDTLLPALQLPSIP